MTLDDIVENQANFEANIMEEAGGNVYDECQQTLLIDCNTIISKVSTVYISCDDVITTAGDAHSSAKFSHLEMGAG